MQHSPQWSPRMPSVHGRRRVMPLLAMGAAVVAAAAGCAAGTTAGGSASGSAGGTPSRAASPGHSAATVSLRTVAGAGRVLVDRTGAALYVNKQETSGHLLCTSGACTTIWKPLTVPSGQMPTAGPGVTAALGTVHRADGATQVTLHGRPLYTFSFDHGAGRVTGNGVSDSFGGTSFTWQAATASGALATGTARGGASSGYGSSGGGYSY